MKKLVTAVTLVGQHATNFSEYRVKAELYPNGHVVQLESFKEADGSEFVPQRNTLYTIIAEAIAFPDGHELLVTEMANGVFVRPTSFPTELISFEVFGISIENPFLSSCGRFELSTPEPYGFEVWDLGGGTKGYGKELPDGNRIILTSEDGNELPEGEKDAFISLLSKFGEPLGSHKVPTAEAIIKRIEGLSHRDLFPEQYKHALVGKKVELIAGQYEEKITGTIERVVPSSFGPLAVLAEYGADRAWQVSLLRQVD